MENWYVVGYQHVEFDTKDGKHIVGTNLFLCRERPNVVGSECCRLFVSSDKLGREEKDIPITGDVAISFNRYGKPDSLTFSL